MCGLNIKTAKQLWKCNLIQHFLLEIMGNPINFHSMVSGLWWPDEGLCPSFFSIGVWFLKPSRDSLKVNACKHFNKVHFRINNLVVNGCVSKWVGLLNLMHKDENSWMSWAVTNVVFIAFKVLLWEYLHRAFCFDHTSLIVCPAASFPSEILLYKSFSF